MADLLECVIQIKALRETLALAETGTLSISENVTAEMERVPVWQIMCEAERRCATALRAESGVLSDSASTPGAPAGAREAFAALRRANLTVLERCTAARLGELVEWPGRPSTTVADLVAIMLANDTEVLGALRRARANPESGPI